MIIKFCHCFSFKQNKVKDHVKQYGLDSVILTHREYYSTFSHIDLNGSV